VQAAAARRTLAIWASVYALSGMLALSFEILWFRLLGVLVKSTAFTAARYSFSS
jgi:DMSO/TMAO reductase YedYZ heme-binding membrane subunit